MPRVRHARNGKVQVLTCLISKRGDSALQDNNGKNSLYFTTFKGNKDIIDTILSHGVDIESNTKDSETLDTVSYLLSRGAKSDYERIRHVLLCTCSVNS